MKLLPPKHIESINHYFIDPMILGSSDENRDDVPELQETPQSVKDEPQPTPIKDEPQPVKDEPQALLQEPTIEEEEKRKGLHRPVEKVINKKFDDLSVAVEIARQEVIQEVNASNSDAEMTVSYITPQSYINFM